MISVRISQYDAAKRGWGVLRKVGVGAGSFWWSIWHWKYEHFLGVVYLLAGLIERLDGGADEADHDALDG